MHRWISFVLVACLTCAAQMGVDQNLQTAVKAGNQAWIDGLRSGNAAIIAATYAPEAVNCTADGQCVSGINAIEAQLRSRVTSMGRAQSASVNTTSLVRDGDFAYEWGYAEAQFGGGRQIRGRYLTVWQRERGAGWKILRNMSLPLGREGREWGHGPRPEQSFTVRCHSSEMGRQTCTAPVEITRAEVLRQISGSPCTKDRTWGWERNLIWVDRGCRAEFTVYGYAAEAPAAGMYPASPQPSSGEAGTEYNDPRLTKTLRCESEDMNYHLCAAGGAVSSARLVRQLSGSECTETKTWGWTSQGVWVDKGCRAEFEVAVR